MKEIKLHNIIEEIPEGIVLLDGNLSIQFYNKVFSKLLSYKEGSPIGKNLRTIDFIQEKQTIKDNFYSDLKERKIIKSLYYIKNNNESIMVYVFSKNIQIDGIDYTLLTIFDISSLMQCSFNVNKIEKRINYLEQKIIGKDEKIKELFKMIKLASESTSNVLINGESGTGKELVARAIHEVSDRRSMNFVTVNCSALSESLLESELFGHVKGSFTGAYKDKIGKFEISHGGTIFLDEIGDITPLTQLKLLRVIEEKTITRVGDNREIKVDMRIVCATNKNLREMVTKGLFREDLFYRLNVFQINTTPLRDRKNDIPVLCEYFIDKFNIKTNKSIKGFKEDVMKLLMDYPWPGNVRELQNVIEHSFIVCSSDYIDLFDLPLELRQFNFREIKAEVSNDHLLFIKSNKGKGVNIKPRNTLTMEKIIEVLKSNNNNKAATARQLGISRIALWKKLKKFNISQ
ncbi:MAG: sigma 54-interacting transcriptional regulator [Spirochaetes bacterium]|nr:sigma 54-interacting transcriptional regulator [Spirochaetota bacterium]